MSKSNSPSGSNSNNNMLHPEGEKQWQSEGIKLAGCSGRHRLSYNELGVAAGAGSVGGTEWLTSARHGPVVVGCTMIDMHVSTKIDDHFEVSLRLHPLHQSVGASRPASLVDRAARLGAERGLQAEVAVG